MLVACLRDIVTVGGERRVGGAETIRWVAHVVTQPALFAPEEPQSKLAEPQLVVAFVLGGEGAAASRGQLRVSEPTPRRGGAPVIPGVHGVLAEEHALHLLAVVAVPVARVVATDHPGKPQVEAVRDQQCYRQPQVAHVTQDAQVQRVAELCEVCKV